MNETTQAPTEPQQATAEAPTASQNEFPGIAETRQAAEKITDSPPSPMPLPINSGADPSTEAATAEKPAQESGRNYPGKDYKKRPFDPRIHEVKEDGSPKYNADGTLRILPKSKQGLADKVKGFFNMPPSDHEKKAIEDTAGEAQARSIAEREEMEASSHFLKEGYFILGETLAGPGFRTDQAERAPRIAAHFMAYEAATGRTFDPPPWLALAVGLGADFRSTVAKVPECRERLDELKSGIFERTVSGMVGKSWIGRTVSSLMFWKRKPKKKESEDAASREFTRSRMESEERGGE